MRKLIIALALAAASALVAPAAAAARPALQVAHHCRPYDQPIRKPVAGFLAVDSLDPTRTLFYIRSDSITSGMLEGWGGTLQLEYKCWK
jgi:hypothetical protein